MSTNLSRQQLDTVSGSFLFAGVDEIMVEQLVEDDRCFRQNYDRGEIVFDETHFRRCLGIVLSGDILVEKNTADRKKLNMSRLLPGECFGAAAMFNTRNRYASILTAKRPTEVLYIPQEVIAWAMQRSGRITENYVSYLADRIWFLSSRISALTAGTVQQKLAAYLLEHGGVDVSLTDLSQQLNIGRASLYRAMDELEAAEIICRHGKEITVLADQRLRNILGGRE